MGKPIRVNLRQTISDWVQARKEVWRIRSANRDEKRRRNRVDLIRRLEGRQAHFDILHKTGKMGVVESQREIQRLQDQIDKLKRKN
ncbi:hypothetical protein IIC68_02380 [archaeon]|nr:hypothetical protein [archaeon]